MIKIARKDILALSGMTFALFMGAGNIVFPPLLGYHSGTHGIVLTIVGFLVTAVVIPVAALIAISRVGGEIKYITLSLGKRISVVFASICFLFMGPLYVAPRTATVALETAAKSIPNFTSVRPFLVLLYFILVAAISLKPEKLLRFVGFLLSPLKITGLIFIALTPFFVTGGGPLVQPVSVLPDAGNGFYDGIINGYLTMDTISALIFGGIICQAVRTKNIEDKATISKVVAVAGGIAGAGMMIVYTGFFMLGKQSNLLLQTATNGAQILHAYVQYIYGDIGIFILELLVFLACLITAVGLVTSSSRYFSSLFAINYKLVMVIVSAISLMMANIGLDKLIYFSLPALTVIYPPGMVLVFLSLRKNGNQKNDRTCRLLFYVSSLFGAISAFRMSAIGHCADKRIYDFIDLLPLNDKGLGWVLPCVLLYLVSEGAKKMRSIA